MIFEKFLEFWSIIGFMLITWLWSGSEDMKSEIKIITSVINSEKERQKFL